MTKTIEQKIEEAIDATLWYFNVSIKKAIQEEEEFENNKAEKVAKCEEEGDYEYARMLDLEQCWYNGIDDAYDEARGEIQRMFYGDDDLDEIEDAVMDACDDALELLRR